MATPVSRGRGYSGRNKDIHRPGNPPASTLVLPYPSAGSDATKPGDLTNLHAAPLPQQLQQMHITQQQNPAHSNPRSNSGQQAVHASIGNPQMVQNNVQSARVSSSQKMAQNTSQPSGERANVYILNKPEQGGHGGQGRGPPAAVGAQDGYARSMTDDNSQSVLYIDERFSYLIQQVGLLSPQDDGILTNQKLQHIEGVLGKVCPQILTLRSALDAIASAGMLDSSVTPRVSVLTCSVWFCRSQLLGRRLHRLFVEALTDKIDGLEISLEGADQYLVNACSLLTDIYTESKCLSPEELNSVGQLIVQVLMELLDCNTILALRTLNVQLMQYGKKLYQCGGDKLDSMSVMARRLLVGKQPPAATLRPWICLLADQCLYRFQPLPTHLQDFYSRHLDESTSNDSEPKDPRFNSSKSTAGSAKPANHSGQETRHPIKSDSSDRWSNTSNGENKEDYAAGKYSMKDDVFEDRGVANSPFDGSAISDSDFNNSEYGQSHSAHSNQGERKPRPILGAGARAAPKNIENIDFSEPPPPLHHTQAEYEDIVEIPEFCPTQPPPNFVPRPTNQEERQNIKQPTTASQDNTDFWSNPPPKLPPANLNKRSTGSSSLSSRLDLNSWRLKQQQENEKNESVASSEDVPPLVLQNKARHHNLPASNSLDYNLQDVITGNAEKRVEDAKERWTKRSSAEQSYDGEKNYNQVQVETGVSHWGKKYLDNSDNSADERKPDNNWAKNKNNERRPPSKDSDEKESNWRRRESEESGKKGGNWGNRRSSSEIKNNEWPGGRQDGSSPDDKRRGERKSESNWEEEGTSPTKADAGKAGKKVDAGKGVRAKRDPMEVSRKASYWTHDDRCDRDYDG